MKIVRPANAKTNQAFAEWVMDRIGRPAVPPYQTMAAVDDDGRIHAGVVFNGYNGANVDITVYAPGGLTRRALREVCEFAFVKLQCTRITARTRRDQRALVADAPLTGKGGIFERMGFVPEAIAARYYGRGPKNDALVYRMLRSECPWIKHEPRHPARRLRKHNRQRKSEVTNG